MDEDRILAAIERLDAKFERLDARVERIEASAERLDARVERLDARVELIEALAERLDARVERLETRIDRIETQAMSFRVEVFARFERIEDTLTHMRDDITVNIGRADRAVTVNDSTRKEVEALATEVTAMWRVVKRVQTDVEDLKGASRPG